MADTTLDDVRIEIDASAESAKESIDKLIKNLEALKEITEKIDTKKLESVRDTFKGFTTFGDGLKKSGDGMRSISSSIRSMSNVDSSKLKDIAEVVNRIGVGLGNLGSNNKISIRIDSAAIKESIQPLEQVKDSLANASVEQSVITVAQAAQSAMSGAAQAADQLATAEERTGKSGNTAATGQQALINKINEYKSIISGMESGKKDFDATVYTEAVNGLEQAQAQFDQFKEKAKNTPKTMEDIAKSISSIGTATQKCGLNTFSGLLNGIAGVLPVISSGSMEASAGFQSMATGLQAVQSAIPIIGIILTVITALANAAKKLGNALKNAFDKAVSAVKSFASKTKQAVSAVVARFEGLKKKVRESFGVQDKSMQNFIKKFKSLARLGTFMLLRKAFTYLFKFIGEGFNNLVLYSDKFATEFSKNVSLLYSDLKWLGNAFATAFEPILNYIAPMLDALVSKIVSVCNALAQFFAALTGKSTWTRAKKLNEDYKKSIDKTKKSVMGLADSIDELHVLRENTDSDTGVTDPEDMFETLPVDSKFDDWVRKLKEAWKNADFTDIGKWIGDKLAEMLANIDWEKIKRNARKLGSSLATLINGFILGSFDGKRVSWWIGRTLAEALNTAFEFLHSFALKLRWKELGKAICDFFIGAFDNLDWRLINATLVAWARGIRNMLNEIFGNTEFWSKAGQFISKGINSLLVALYNFVIGFDATKFGEAMGIFLTNALTKINFPLLGQMLSIGITKAFEALYSFAEKFDFDTLADKISGMINNLFDIDWESIRNSFGTACSKFGAFISRILVGEDGEGGINWGQIGESLMAALVTVIEGIGKFFAEQNPEEIGKKIAEFVNSAFNYLAENKGVVVDSINAIINTLSGIFNAAISGEDGIQWETIFSTIGDIVAGIEWGDMFTTAFEAIAGAWTFDKIFKIDILSNIGKSIISSIEDGIDSAMEGFSEWIGEHFGEPIQNAFNKAFGIGEDGESSMFGTAGQRVVEGFKNGIQLSVPGLHSTIADEFAGQVGGWLCEKLGIGNSGSGNSAVFESYGNMVVDGFQNGITRSVPGLQTIMDIEFAAKISKWFCDKLGIHSPSVVFQGYGQNTVQGFQNGINAMISSLSSTILGLGTKILGWFRQKIDSSTLVSAGKNLVQGLINGISNMVSSLKSSVQTMANNVSSWFAEKLKIHSPSRLFYSYGQFTVEGFNNAIDQMAGSTKKIVDDWTGSFRNMEVGVGFSVDYSSFDDYKVNDGSDFVASATNEIQSTIDANSNRGNEFDYDTMGYVYKEAMREVMSQIVVPAIENVGRGGGNSGYGGNMGLLKAVQDAAAIYTKSTGLDPFPA